MSDIDRDIRKALDRGLITIRLYNAGGAGGQHQNRTLSAVELRHVETGIRANATRQRSQHANKRAAWRILLSKVRARRIEDAAPDRRRTAGFSPTDRVRTPLTIASRTPPASLPAIARRWGKATSRR